MAAKKAAGRKTKGGPSTKSYTHPSAEALLRPDVGTEAHFRKKKPPQRYTYDSSLSPGLDWDGQGSARETAEWLLALIEEAAKLQAPHLFDTPRELRGAGGAVRASIRGLEDAVRHLRGLSRPFLNWAGKAERLSFEVPTLPLFVHERLSTRAILETLKGHKRDRQLTMFDLFSDPERPITDQVLRAYEHKDGWTNRLVLGDSLVVMNSLLNFEGMGGQVQMIYMDPFDGDIFHPGMNACWKTTVEGLDRLARARRIQKAGRTLRYVRYLDDFPAHEITNLWDDVAGAPDKLYVVQTSPSVIARCILFTTDPGDLVLDPTCGSGTTAYVAEQWGRRWITIDTSRVPLALARQRLLTATYPFYQLKEQDRGPAGGFVYTRKNSRGEEVGGIVPHVTLKSLANDEPPAEEVLVDCPEEEGRVVRVTGPFCFEATIPSPLDVEESATPVGETRTDEGESYGSFVERLLEVLRQSPVLALGGGKTMSIKGVRRPAKTLALSAEAVSTNGEGQPVAFVFGPENGAVAEKLVFEAAREARAKSYAKLVVIGFAIQPNARALVEKCEDVAGIPAVYVQATPDLMMGDLLKNMRSSQIFSVCGLPEVDVRPARDVNPKGAPDAATTYEVELLGLDVFDPVEMKTDHRSGMDVPAWLLDTDYNDLCFHVSQAFFPRTAAWDDLKRSLKGEYEDDVWQHLAGTVSAPFEAGEHRQVAVKVIDDRGNELLVVRPLPGAKHGRGGKS